MKNSLRSIVLLFAMVLPVSLHAGYFDTLMVYNGEDYNYGYVRDFQVDGISYLISDSAVAFVSADTCLFGYKDPEVVINSLYHGAVTIPERVMYGGIVYDVRGIDIAAFQGCSNLDSVSIPYSVSVIEKYAFRNCTNLEGIYLSTGIKGIERYAFSECTRLKSVELPKGLGSLGDGVFYGCTDLQYITIPRGLPYLFGDFIEGCSQLKKIFILSGTPLDVQYNGGVGYGEHFDGVSRTDCTIYVPEYSIEDYQRTGVWSTFRNIEPIPGLLTEGSISYTINSPTEKTVSIVEAKCSGDYTIPASITIGGEQYTITGIDDYAFSGNQSLHSVSFPESLTYIGKYAFAGCIAIDSLTIPENIEYLDNYSFYNCRTLRKLVIKGNTLLYETAFAWCENIDSIIIESTNPPTLRDNYDPWFTTNGPFEDWTYWSAAVSIPEGSFYLYAASDTWSAKQKN